ncbi:hypothetical protein C2869_08975 [Saccharobesus litoralis]|uniref:HDOD domain-containing protein n=1 Tax=Saccharobesus litoralis TaxID=2172099 RepID=A0A2S0VQS5_9ALTE|nr:hypothetical protein [Saccharobesus litoralis]AWB66554.1 hypothetical protein C2869_08975 [Saccharobesus litoralis]
MSDKSLIEDIPFDGDTSKPLPESLKKVRRTHINYSMKLLEQPEFQQSPADELLTRFLAYGKPPEQAVIDESEQEELNRVRLDVEIEAIKRRQFEKRQAQEKIEAAYRSVDLMLGNNLEKVLDKPIKFIGNHKDLGFYKVICSELGAEHLSVNQFAGIVESCSWITQDYIRIANNSMVRSDLQATNAPEATDVKSAINILGVANASCLFPRLIIEYNYRQHAGLAKDMWNRLIKFQQLSSIAAYKLARHFGLDGDHLFLTSALSALPYMAFLNMYTSEAKRAKLASYNKALSLQDDFRLSVLDNYEPGSELLYKLYHFAPSFTTLAIDSLNLIHLPAVSTLEGESGFEDRQLLLRRAQGFATFRLLLSAKLIEPEQANGFLKAHNIDQVSLDVLQNIDFARINLYKMRD